MVRLKFANYSAFMPLYNQSSVPNTLVWSTWFVFGAAAGVLLVTMYGRNFGLISFSFSASMLQSFVFGFHFAPVRFATSLGCVALNGIDK